MNRILPEQVLARLQQLPALPTVVTELLASFDNEDVDIGQVVWLIARDQMLTARLLRVANSPFYALQNRVGTINEAVVVLGFRAVRSMVLAIAMRQVFRAEHCPGFDPQAYVHHSLGVALAARELARICGRNPELAFVGGILHDIGELVLASCFSEQYTAALVYQARHDCPLIVAEGDILGLDHAAVGGLLADSWNFPASLKSAVAEHHSPSAALADSLADLTHVGDAIAHGLGQASSNREMVMPLDPTAWRRLGLDGGKVGRILPLVTEGMGEGSQAFSA